MMVWHYTVGMHTLRILDEGILRPADIKLIPGEKPILWFSSNPFWELTANKSIKDPKNPWSHLPKVLSMQETSEAGGGLFRFGVPIERTIKWPEVGKRAGTKAWLRNSLMKVARDQKADPKDWYGIIGSLAFDASVRLQVLDRFRVWVAADLARVEQEMDCLRIRVRQLDPEELDRLALDRFRAFGGVASEDGEDPAFMDRIRVNFIRHNLTDYDDRIEKAHRLPGMDGVIRMIRRKIYWAISAAYPELEGECERQLEVRGI